MCCHNNHWRNRIGSCLLEVACQFYIFILEKLTSRAFSKDLNIKETIKVLLTSTDWEFSALEVSFESTEGTVYILYITCDRDASYVNEIYFCLPDMSL